MKKLTLLLTMAITSAILFSACKKDNPTTTTTAIQKIQAKWIFDKAIFHNVYPGNNSRDTMPGKPGEYFEFKNNNKVYILVDAQLDSSNYTLIGDSKIDFEGDTAIIQVLNDHQLQFKFNEITSPVEYYEGTYYLKK